MQALPVPNASFQHVSRLFGDYLYHFDRVRAFYHLSPLESSGYSTAANSVRVSPEHRSRLVDALREQNPGSPALERLAQPGTCVVATGQQVGLFLGPAYTIYKALTAARLAKDLEARGIPAVPVFWMATEDHDFAEVNHCWVFGPGHRPQRIEVAGDVPDHRPVGPIPITGDPAGILGEALTGLPCAAEVLDLAADAYAPGRTMGEAFAALLRKLLGPYGLLLLDPLHPAIRQLAAPILAEAAERAPELVTLLLERNRELDAAGYHAQVHVEPDSSRLFSLDGGSRAALRLKNGALPPVSRPESLSPNALLRPVVQDYLLPTVATVMGPAEIAYVAQSEVLYRSLLGHQPVAVNRASFTVADSRSKKVMDRYQLSLADLSGGEEPLRDRIGRALVPEAVQRDLAGTATGIAERLESLRAGLTAFDPTLTDAMDRSRKKMLYQLQKLERKVARETLRREQRAGEEAAYLYALLYPVKQPQERVYSILPLLAKHGLDLIDTIYQNIRPGSPDHQLLFA